MPFARTGMRSMTLFGPSGVLSTRFALKSTGKPTSGVKLVDLKSPFSKFAIQVQSATTVATSRFSVTLIGSLSSANPGKLGSSKYSVLVATYSSGSLGLIKFSTTLTPAQFVGIRSTIFTTAAGRGLNISIAAVP